MKINDVEFSASLNEILNELISQLRANDIQYMQKTIETPTHIQVCCPFHSEGLERRPSAGIRKSDGLFHCFACNEVHSLPEVISHCFGKDNTGFFGWNWLLKNFASVDVENRKPIHFDLKCRENVSEQATFVSEEELDSYRYLHPYMYKRKLTDQVIEMFDIGYDRKTDCITFPNRDMNGNCLFVARRSVHTKYFNYPQGVEKPVYGLYELDKQLRSPYELRLKIGDNEYDFYHQGQYFAYFEYIIICESMLDALTCCVYGKPAVALNGLGTESQFKTLRDYPYCRKYVIATDMDERGLQARKKIKKALNNKIVTEYIWDLNVAKDINDMNKEYFYSLEEYF